MESYIAILRGINVSGQKKIKMEDLRQLLAELNFHDIQTYIQSGNVIFEHKKSDPLELAGQIAHQISDKYSFEVPVIVKTAAELEHVLHNNPFLKDRQEDESKLHVTFLSEIPKQELLNKIKELDHKPDEFIISDKAIYLFCPNGYGRTKLTNNFFENKLKVTATTRNWKTVNKLVEIARSK